MGDYEELFDKIEDQRQQQEQMNNYLKEKGKLAEGEEQLLLDELDELESGEAIEQLQFDKVPAYKARKQKEEDEMIMLERQLEELSLPTDASSDKVNSQN